MCKNGLGLFAQKWLQVLEIWCDESSSFRMITAFAPKIFTKIFIFEWVIAIFVFWSVMTSRFGTLKKIRPYIR